MNHFDTNESNLFNRAIFDLLFFFLFLRFFFLARVPFREKINLRRVVPNSRYVPSTAMRVTAERKWTIGGLVLRFKNTNWRLICGLRTSAVAEGTKARREAGTVVFHLIRGEGRKLKLNGGKSLSCFCCNFFFMRVKHGFRLSEACKDTQSVPHQLTGFSVILWGRKYFVVDLHDVFLQRILFRAYQENTMVGEYLR